MNRFSCFIFDLDGTLTQTNELIFATFNYVTEKYIGKKFSPAEITAMFGPPEEIAIERLVGKNDAPAAIEDFFQYYRQRHLELANAYPGIGEILNYLKQSKVTLAVFTGKGRTSAEITLQLVGFSGYFDLLVTGTDVTNHKPSGEGIIKILNEFNLDPKNVVMVGDAVGDVKAAREAGTSMAAVVWDSYAKQEVISMNTDYLFYRVEDFTRWIKEVIPGNGVRHSG